METLENPRPVPTAIAHLGEELRNLTETITGTISAEKIICFGSTIHHVKRKSCFEEDPIPIANIPVNSYSLLIIPTQAQSLQERAILQLVEGACKPLARVTAIVHPMEEVNTAIQRGSSFFIGVYKKGVLLYDRNEIPFATPGVGKAINSRIDKREQFWDQWHGMAQGFLEGARFYHGTQRYNLAVHLLHQAARHCYIGLLRVQTGYRTNSNSLRRLQRLMESTVPNAPFILPISTPADAHLTNILMKEFSDIQYSHRAEVEERDAAALMEHVDQLILTADQRCRKRIEQYKAGKIAYIA